jgi:hypothetical protein
MPKGYVIPTEAIDESETYQKAAKFRHAAAHRNAVSISGFGVAQAHKQVERIGS